MTCYFCNQEAFHTYEKSQIYHCLSCKGNDLEYVYTVYRDNKLLYAHIYLYNHLYVFYQIMLDLNKNVTKILLATPLNKNATKILLATSPNDLIAELPGLPINPKNAKQKLSIYLTFL